MPTRKSSLHKTRPTAVSARANPTTQPLSEARIGLPLHRLASASALMSADEVASVLGCSRRHVYRLSDGGYMPSPVKLGALARWRTDEINDWIISGCKPPNRPSRRGA